jgi:hypothetical protein
MIKDPRKFRKADTLADVLRELRSNGAVWENFLGITLCAAYLFRACERTPQELLQMWERVRNLVAY